MNLSRFTEIFQYRSVGIDNSGVNNNTIYFSPFVLLTQFLGLPPKNNPLEGSHPAD